MTAPRWVLGTVRPPEALPLSVPMCSARTEEGHAFCEDVLLLCYGERWVGTY